MTQALEERLSQLESAITAIEKRNKQVEQDKLWETSLARKIIITMLTYATLAILMMSFAIPYPWTNALVPTIGFILSSLSLPLFKNIWATWKNNSRIFPEK